VLPNVLWQILRPYISGNADFDRSFAETFAVPEFRTIGSGAAKACSKMLGLLATYREFSEETAAKLLSNDLLIDRLRAVQLDTQFQKEVESAVAAENTILLEEMATLARQVESLRLDGAMAELKIEQVAEAAARELAEARAAMLAKQSELEVAADSRRQAEARSAEFASSLAEMEKAKTAAVAAAEREAGLRLLANGRALRNAKLTSVLVALLVILAVEIAIHSVWKWGWLLRHPNSYGLQGCFSAFVACGIVGLWVVPWRKALWVTGGVGAVFVILQLLGGPSAS
jgi:hypothetical protein